MKDLFIAPPITGTGDQAVEATYTLDGVMCLATSTSSQLIKIPTKWLGRELMFTAVGLDIDVVFGSSTASVTVNQVSTVASNELTLNAATGDTIFAGTKEIFSQVNNSGQNYFAFRSTGTTGFLKVRPADVRHTYKY